MMENIISLFYQFKVTHFHKLIIKYKPSTLVLYIKALEILQIAGKGSVICLYSLLSVGYLC